MKQYFAALAATTLISLAPHAVASTTDLTLTGTITPAACTPNLSEGGVVDLGKISKSDLNLTGNTVVGTQTMYLNVSCVSPAKFALRSIDNKAGTPSNRDWYGLGLTEAGEKIGFLIPIMKSTLADGQTAQSIISWDNGAVWTGHHHLRPNLLISAAAPSDHSTPIPVQDLALELALTTYIARADSLTLTDEVNVDGSVTFEMKYL
ncbi:DUF1120 domain-containing protein [Pseudomonas sp. REP124]|uniref:DUF1120 domain-containing protein n=1 Tax=Pseudomonas sp. REP124 TaxID=2875731 RepID=UPI001CCEF5DF|nr:DUF1120 domain-containing protein [Pseudomonas sp. REP124]MBZ9781435.1 DUF1120 domain-containing protein [Pseudomonas sp. REP124]